LTPVAADFKWDIKGGRRGMRPGPDRGIPLVIVIGY